MQLDSILRDVCGNIETLEVKAVATVGDTQIRSKADKIERKGEQEEAGVASDAVGFDAKGRKRKQKMELKIKTHCF